MTRTLITGASSGIGAALACELGGKGHDLVLCARRLDRLETLAGELRSRHGIDVRVHAVDLAAPAARAELLTALLSDPTPIDILVNNAGFGTLGPFWKLDANREAQQVEVNVGAMVHLTRGLLPGMVARARGAVLNVASTAGFQPGPYMATYYASKAFVVSFTEALARELAGTGVRAVAFCPGPTFTEFGAVSGNERTLLFKLGGERADAVARQAARALEKGAAVAVPGFTNKAGSLAVRLLPRTWVSAITARLNR